ncbi:MAG: hypothetical protein PHH47_07030 [Gallionella sp.]|nr:hypothetical protein [Gallionella sp.]MDD4946681.1 hypothetical protein [Gallionella sp.]MDD5612762.1 hypothetical protein [Gallionella sp.]
MEYVRIGFIPQGDQGSKAIDHFRQSVWQFVIVATYNLTLLIVGKQAGQ